MKSDALSQMRRRSTNTFEPKCMMCRSISAPDKVQRASSMITSASVVVAVQRSKHYHARIQYVISSQNHPFIVQGMSHIISSSAFVLAYNRSASTSRTTKKRSRGSSSNILAVASVLEKDPIPLSQVWKTCHQVPPSNGRPFAPYEPTNL